MRTLMQSALAAAILLAGAASSQAGTAERLYVIDCGFAHATDQSVWSPGVNAGVPIDFANNCYLVHHAGAGYLLWDTGITDRLVALPDGVAVPGLSQTWHRGGTLLAALAALGVKPADVRYVVLSHVHPDHAGNVDEFPDATLVIQKAEWDYAMTLPQKPFDPARKVEQIQGDRDLFGDGSVVIISTPGHTPGHQSMLVRLSKTGTVLLTGDAAHFQDNFENRRVPRINADRDQTLASMQRISDFLAREQAKLWINHDKPSSDARRHGPQFYE